MRKKDRSVRISLVFKMNLKKDKPETNEIFTYNWEWAWAGKTGRVWDISEYVLYK